VAYVEQKERNTGSGMSPTPSYMKDDENKMKEDDRCPWKRHTTHVLAHFHVEIAIYSPIGTP